MTSKNSTPNTEMSNTSNTTPSFRALSLWRLMLEDLRHRTWMLVLSVLGSFIASPVAFLFYDSGIRYRSSYVVDPSEAWYQELSTALIHYFGSAHLVLQMIVIYVGVLIVAIFGFRHLFSQEMTDLYHCVPVTRNRMFVANYLNSFLIWFVPFLVGHLFVYILALCTIGNPAYWGAVSAIVFKEILLFVLCFLVLYTACLVPIMISGNGKNAIMNILIYGLSFYLGFAALIGYMQFYFDTCYLSDEFTFTASIAVIVLSPLVAPIFMCLWFAEFHALSGGLSAIAASADNWHSFWIGIFLMLFINLALAVVLYRKRPSELAGRGVENKIFRIPLRLVTSILSGLLLALFFSAMSEDRGQQLGWSIFGGIFGTVLAFCVMNIMYHASFKAVLSHKLQLGGSILAVCVIVLIFRFDMFGYDTYLPAKETIKGISVYSSAFKGAGYKLLQNEEGYYYTEYGYDSVPDNLIYTNQDAIYTFLQLMTDRQANHTKGYNVNPNARNYSIDVRVDTTKGSYYRQYSFFETAEIEAALAPIINNEEFVEHYNPIGCGTMNAPTKIIADSLDNTQITITDPKAITQIYQAYTEDFASHYSLDNKITGYNLIDLDFMYPMDENGGYRYATIAVPAWYTQTIHTLQELYPSSVWSQEELTYTNLEVNIGSDCAGDQLSELQAYLGLGEAAANVNNSSVQPTNKRWQANLSDPEDLEALRPYLYLDTTKNYYDGEYIYIGNMTTYIPDSANAPQPVTYYCHAKYGELPSWFTERLSLSNE